MRDYALFHIIADLRLDLLRHEGDGGGYGGNLRDYLREEYTPSL